MSDYIKAAISDFSDEPLSVREELASSPTTAPSILETLAKDANWSVRAYVAENPNTPWNALVELGQDPVLAVRSRACVPYSVEIGFCGMIGASEFIEVEARPEITEDELIQHIREQYDIELMDLLEVTEATDLGDGDWEVTLNFGGYIGCDETYDTIYASDEDDATEQALNEAIWDFTIISFECLRQQ